MRIPGIGGEIINRLGGTAVNMPPGEIMPALQQGVIDATEWVGPWVDKISGYTKLLSIIMVQVYMNQEQLMN